ncbi:MAG: ABC transporter ATP-binding protein [Candidatus Omnitrophota bacterium]
MSSKLLEIFDLECGYDNFSLSGINLTVQKGGFIGIIGPNGSGKTTMLKAVAGILKIKSGKIIFDDEDLINIKRTKLAKKIAVVSQTEEHIPITVEEYVLLGRTPHFRRFQFFETKNDLAAVHSALRGTHTEHIKGKSLLEISSGERQLASIAAALAQEPLLLLLDEPTSHLDIGNQVKILNLLKRLHKEKGFTVIVILHDLNLASQYCDRLVLLNKGKAHSQGLPGQVITKAIIEDVYQTNVEIGNHPSSNTPYVFLA